jgi:hypothetical protein
MADLIQSCGTIVTTPINAGCGKDKISYPRMFVVWAYGTTLTAVGENPTPAEIQTSINNGLSFVMRFSNGVLTPENRTEIAGTDTESGLPEIDQVTQSITGNVRNINNNTRKMFAQLNLNLQQVQMGWIADNGRFHGGKAGFACPFYMGDIEHAGDGSQVAIPFTLTWKKEFYSFTNYSGIDTDYLALNNLANIGTFTITDVVGTTGSKSTTGYDGITGWNKTTYPTIYAKYVTATTTISFYSSDSARTAGTGTAVLGTVDVSAGETVTQANASGFGGSIDIIAVDFTNLDTWNIAFTA